MSVKRSAWCTDALPPPRNAHLPDPFVDLKRVPKRCQFQTQKAYIFGTIFGSTSMICSPQENAHSVEGEDAHQRRGGERSEPPLPRPRRCAFVFA